MNYADPITPGDTARYIAKMLETKARLLRDEAKALIGRAEALESAVGDVENTGWNFDKYQPAPPEVGGPDQGPDQGGDE